MTLPKNTLCFWWLFKNCVVVCTWFVYNGIYLLNHVKICLIIGVFNTSPPPWYIGQLTCGQRVAYITSPYKTAGKKTLIKHSNRLLKLRFPVDNRVGGTCLPVSVLTTDRRIVGGLIISLRTLDSVASGKPLSSISSRSSYTVTTLSLITPSEHSPK